MEKKMRRLDVNRHIVPTLEGIALKIDESLTIGELPVYEIKVNGVNHTYSYRRMNDLYQEWRKAQ